jgi:hypothetical protein
MQSEAALHEGGNRLLVRFEDGVSRKLDQNLSSYCFLHPVVLEESNRVCMFKLKKPNTGTPREIIMLGVNFTELRLAEDYAMYDVWIFDLATCSLNDSLKMTPSIIVKTLAIYEVAQRNSPSQLSTNEFHACRKCFPFA